MVRLFGKYKKKEKDENRVNLQAFYNPIKTDFPLFISVSQPWSRTQAHITGHYRNNKLTEKKEEEKKVNRHITDALLTH